MTGSAPEDERGRSTTGDELRRAMTSRTAALQGAGQAALGRLARARVLVVGAGGLGAPVLQYLAGAGLAAVTVVDHDTEIAETLMMTLRLTQRGVLRQEFQQRFGTDLLDIHGETIDRFAHLGLLDVSAERVRFTERGRLLSNIVLRELV